MMSLNDMLHVCGGPYKAIIGATPQLPGIRGYEIEEWLKNTSENVERYVIIDDDSDMLDYQMPFFFKTHMQSGLITRDAVKIIKFLNTGERENANNR